MKEIKPIKVVEGNQTVEEKLEVLKRKINEIIEFLGEKDG